MNWDATNTTEKACFDKLSSIGQTELLAHFDTLDPQQKSHLIRQISSLDIPLLHRMQSLTQEHLNVSMEPFQHYSRIGNVSLQNVGQHLVRDGKVALVVLAGGQGTRLRYSGPKGCYPVSLIQQKSLFQLLMEKVKAAGVQAGRALQLSIMTSPLNRAETEDFFARHDFFGLDSAQITFFSQNMWPFLDLEGKLFLEKPGQIAYGPNGNGAFFKCLVETGIWERWNQQGVQIVNCVPIDNPLADPFDEELFGTHVQERSDATLKVIWKRDAEEPVGVLSQINGKTVVVEYSEMTQQEKTAVDELGNLKYRLANIGLQCFSIPFIKKVANQDLPLHKAKKEAALDGKKILAWKFEEFIFDALPFADHVHALLYPRELTFAPLKNLKGEDSISTVKEALLAFDKQRYAMVTGVKPPEEARFELAPQFYYPTPELLQKWKDRPLPKEEYIHE